MTRKKWNEIHLLKTQRNEKNQSIKQIKEDTAVIRTQLEAKKRRYILLKKRSPLISKTTLQNNIERYTQQIKDLDWKIQTTPLSRENEEQIISQIKYLEEQLSITKNTITLKKNQERLMSTINELAKRRTMLHKQKDNNVQKSQEYHTKMLELIKEVDQIKAKADSAHNNYIKISKKITGINNEYLEITNQIKILTLTLKKSEESSKKKKLNLILEEHSKKAYEKMKQQKKLTLNEYKLLRKKGLA
jgi:phosphoserine phosphatase